MEYELNFTVNGKKISLQVGKTERLLDILRNRLNLTGAKESCGEGECGACSIILNGKLVNSCLVIAPQVQGGVVETIEGLSCKEAALLQEAFVKTGAIQCGFCTPALIMAAKDLLSRNSNPDKKEIREQIAGNLCRCTGYEKIVLAIEYGARELRNDREGVNSEKPIYLDRQGSGSS